MQRCFLLPELFLLRMRRSGRLSMEIVTSFISDPSSSFPLFTSDGSDSIKYLAQSDFSSCLDPTAQPSLFRAFLLQKGECEA